MKHLKKTMLASALTACLPWYANASLIIDDFTAPDPGQVGLFQDSNPAAGPGNRAEGSVMQGTSSMIADQRDVILDLTSGSGLATVLSSQGSTGGTPPGILTLENGPTAISELSLTWTAGGPFNLAQSNGKALDKFIFILETRDLGEQPDPTTPVLPFAASLTLTDGDGTMEQVAIPGVDPTIAIPPAQTLTVPYSDFTAAMDFANITTIDVFVETLVPAADFTISLFKADVPEPASLALMVSGLMGLGAVRRRKTRQ